MERISLEPQWMYCPECEAPQIFGRAIEAGISENVELLLGICENCGTDHTAEGTAFRANDAHQPPNIVFFNEDNADEFWKGWFAKDR